MSTSPPSPVIVAGIGNTSVQWGCFGLERKNSLPQPLHFLTAPVAEDAWRAAVDADFPDLWSTAPCCLISVNRGAGQRVEAWLRNNHPHTRYRWLSHGDFPLRLAVDFPARVGLDRVAAGLAARQLRPPGRCALIVDAGTAITVNALDGTGDFVGGAILPGVTASCMALVEATDQLPTVDVPALGETPRAIGRNTEAAMRSGVHWGAVGAIRELVARFRQELNDPAAPLLLTGGYSQALEVHLGEPVQRIPHLVLAGVALAAQTAIATAE